LQWIAKQWRYEFRDRARARTFPIDEILQELNGVRVDETREKIADRGR